MNLKPVGEFFTKGLKTVGQQKKLSALLFAAGAGFGIGGTAVAAKATGHKFFTKG